MDAEGYFKYFAALAFVLGLIAVVSWIMRRAGLMRPMVSGGTQRLRVIEMTPIDNRRRLVLVQRDDVQHLLLLAPDRELVIETGIAAADAGARK